MNIIKNDIHSIDVRYRHGPSLYFYSKTINRRRQTPRINKFLKDEYNIELLYATLASWDMNSRGAKMKDFLDFRQNIEANIDIVKALDKESDSILTTDLEDIKKLLALLYNGLSLMINVWFLIRNYCIFYSRIFLCRCMARTPYHFSMGILLNLSTSIWRY